MSDCWGGSWGDAWGGSWGATDSAAPADMPSGPDPRLRDDLDDETMFNIALGLILSGALD